MPLWALQDAGLNQGSGPSLAYARPTQTLKMLNQLAPRLFQGVTVDMATLGQKVTCPASSVQEAWEAHSSFVGNLTGAVFPAHPLKVKISHKLLSL